jgi:hypothetical protein
MVASAPVTVSEPANPHALVFRDTEACLWEKTAGADGGRRPRGVIE